MAFHLLSCPCKKQTVSQTLSTRSLMHLVFVTWIGLHSSKFDEDICGVPPMCVAMWSKTCGASLPVASVSFIKSDFFAKENKRLNKHFFKNTGTFLPYHCPKHFTIHPFTDTHTVLVDLPWPIKPLNTHWWMTWTTAAPCARSVEMFLNQRAVTWGRGEMTFWLGVGGRAVSDPLWVDAAVNVCHSTTAARLLFLFFLNKNWFNQVDPPDVTNLFHKGDVAKTAA